MNIKWDYIHSYVLVALFYLLFGATNFEIFKPFIRYLLAGQYLIALYLVINFCAYSILFVFDKKKNHFINIILMYLIPSFFVLVFFYSTGTIKWILFPSIMLSLIRVFVISSNSK